MPDDQPLALAVLISGSGTTLANLARRIDRGTLNARIAIVIASNARAIKKLQSNMPQQQALLIDRKSFDGIDSYSAAVFDAIGGAGAEIVCCAGFLSLLAIPEGYANRVLNIHPALLPGFGGRGMYGHRVHEAVLAAGCKVSGCTVHFADQTYDTGPILVQRSCPVKHDDTPQTLAARVFRQERIAYPEAINLIAARRVRVEGNIARVLPEPATSRVVAR